MSPAEQALMRAYYVGKVDALKEAVADLQDHNCILREQIGIRDELLESTTHGRGGTHDRRDSRPAIR
jgi:hypothetical protein